MSAARSPQHVPALVSIECDLCGDVFLLAENSSASAALCKLCPACSAVVKNDEELIMSQSPKTNSIEFTDNSCKDDFGFEGLEVESLEELASIEEEEAEDVEKEGHSYIFYSSSDSDFEGDYEDDEDDFDEDDFDEDDFDEDDFDEDDEDAFDLDDLESEDDFDEDDDDEDDFDEDDEDDEDDDEDEDV